MALMHKQQGCVGAKAGGVRALSHPRRLGPTVIHPRGCAAAAL